MGLAAARHNFLGKTSPEVTPCLTRGPHATELTGQLGLREVPGALPECGFQQTKW